MSIFDTCGDSCGWIAAFIAALTYGSFGVPIRATAHIKVHPFVMQSYKTFVVFLTSWLTLWMGEQARWTPWGLLSGLLWVSGGTCGIYGIRQAGLSVAVGVWASVMVLVNFTWGILIFSEPIHSIIGTILAFFLLGLGLVGMSRYSAPMPKEKDTDEEVEDTVETIEPADEENRALSFQILSDPVAEESDQQPKEFLFPTFSGGHLALTKRQLGIIGAVLNGILTGSSLVPVHYAKQQGLGGASYMISFATGSLLANLLLWALFFAYKLYRAGAVSAAYGAMPEWNFKTLWLPGFVAGFLLSVAMFCSILAVTYLGQGIGNSVVQSKILISGLWGIFVFREIRERDSIFMWFMSALVAIGGILLMSYERQRALMEDDGGQE